MWATDRPLRQWLQDSRRTNQFQLELVAQFYDLDGARAAGQWELAWRARDCMLRAAVQLHLCTVGVPFADPADWVSGADAALRALDRINPELGARAWALALTDAPDGRDDLTGAIDATLEFIRTGLGIPYRRDDAVRVWAGGVRLLRDVASTVGLAQSDAWYITGNDALDSSAGWYEAIMSTLDQEAAQRPGPVR